METKSLSGYLAIIPARQGSKGIPGKNTKPLGGRPLIDFTIAAAKGVFDKRDICISTDDPRVIDIAIQHDLEIPFIRPDSLASDTARSEDVIIHALEEYRKQGREFEAIVLLQPTSPFRKDEHIREALKLFDDNMDAVISGKVTDSNPYYLLWEKNSNGVLVRSKQGNFTRRQDCPEVYEFNGAIYIVRVESLYKHKSIADLPLKQLYVMDKLDSIDVDDMVDWHICEALLEKEVIRIR